MCKFFYKDTFFFESVQKNFHIKFAKYFLRSGIFGLLTHCVNNSKQQFFFAKMLKNSLFAHNCPIKLPYFPNIHFWNLLFFHINKVQSRWYFCLFSLFSILSVLVSLNLSSHSFAFIASHLFHLELSPPNLNEELCCTLTINSTCL